MVRTSIAVISFGFVVARVVPLIHQTNAPSGEPVRRFAASAAPLGIGMVAFGALLTTLAGWRYHLVNRAIEAGYVKADRALVLFVTMLVALLAGALIIYMLAAR
jgi:uncharacterized membrane protein YidH (DUF202 family)